MREHSKDDDIIQNPPMVSVIVPVYQTAPYLRDTVHSVLGQVGVSLQVILVNDGSTDDSPRICDELGRTHANIQVIHQSNGGLSSARNAGLACATGRYIVFLDSDDQFTSSALQDLLAKATLYGADVILPDRRIEVRENDKRSRELPLFASNTLVEDPVLFARLALIAGAHGWSSTGVLYNGNLLREKAIEFPVGYIAEDRVFNLAVLSAATKVAFLAKSTVSCLRRQGSITTSYQSSLNDVTMFIDKTVGEFGARTLGTSQFLERDQLLARNTVTFLMSIAAENAPLTGAERKRLADGFLAEPRVQQALQVRSIRPFFDAAWKRGFYRMVRWLLKHDCRSPAFMLTRLAGVVR